MGRTLSSVRSMKGDSLARHEARSPWTAPLTPDAELTELIPG